MKTAIASVLFVLATSVPVVGMPAEDHGGHGAMHSNAATESALSEGIVKKVDKSAGKVTITHTPLINLNMPAMTMAFRVKDAAWLDQMQMGNKIRFLAETVNGSLTIVRFEPTK